LKSKKDLLLFGFNHIALAMSANTKLLLNTSILFIMLLLVSCREEKKKDPPKPEKGRIKTEVKKETETKNQRPPIINIVDTVAPKMTVIYCKDSAATFERIGLKLGKIYGTKLPEYIKKNNLKTAGAPMAWYTKQKAPFFFDAGIPVNKAGSKSVKGVQIRQMNGGKALIVHFYGPFELLPQGYDAVKEWMKENKKTLAGPSYEIYITDPIDKNGKPVDPYKIQTDIVFPIK
jgi:effector-binding domain-containing protein